VRARKSHSLVLSKMQLSLRELLACAHPVAGVSRPLMELPVSQSFASHDFRTSIRLTSTPSLLRGPLSRPVVYDAAPSTAPFDFTASVVARTLDRIRTRVILSQAFALLQSLTISRCLLLRAAPSANVPR
jgi:hypothetical protein